MKGVRTSDSDVQRIIAAAATACGCDAVAAATGLSRSTCYRVLRRANLLEDRKTEAPEQPAAPRGTDYGDWPPSWAYVVGWTVADGHLSLSPRHVVGWQLADRDAVEMIQTAMGVTAAIETCRRTHGTYYRLRLHGRAYTDRFLAAGILPRKTDRIVVPEMPPDSLPHFLRGVCDGDGCVRIGRARRTLSAKITSCCQSFLQDVRSRLGYGSVSQSGPRTFDLQFHCRSAVRFLSYIYADCGDLKLRRKWERWQAFLATGHRYGSYRRQGHPSGNR